MRTSECDVVLWQCRVYGSHIRYCLAVTHQEYLSHNALLYHPSKYYIPECVILCTEQSATRSDLSKVSAYYC